MERKRKRSSDSNFEFTIYSFAYKNGIPQDCIYYADLRGLENSSWKVPGYKTKTGVDKEISEFVFSSKRSKEKYQEILTTLKEVKEFSKRKGLRSAGIGIGCKSGQHRSVAFVELLSAEASLNIVNIKHLEQMEVQTVNRLSSFHCSICGVSPKGCNEINTHMLSKKHFKKKVKLSKRQRKSD